MKQVGIREAQINLTKLLNELPFSITRFGKEVAIVIEPAEQNEEVTTFNENAPSRPSVEELRQQVDTINQKYEQSWGNMRLYCQICRKSPAQSLTYQDENSDQHEGIFCKEHTDRYNKEKQSTINLDKLRPFNIGITPFNPIPKPEPKKKK